MAKTTNLGNPYTHRITLRLTDEQYEYIIATATILGVSPSDYLRMTVNAGMIAYQTSNIQQMMKTYEGKEGTSIENVKTNQHDIV